MGLNGGELICREYHFDRGASISEFTSATNGTGAISYTANTTKGVELQVTAAADRAFLHWNGRLGFDIDDLDFIEFLFRIEGWHANTDAVLGLGSAFNVDPDAIQESAWFRIGGSTEGRKVYLETDDNVTNSDDIYSGYTLADNSWNRARIAFGTGIQSIGPPSASKGGKSSLQFTLTDANGYTRHCRVNQHMDMSGYSAGLQPIFGMRQVTNAAGAAVKLYVKKIEIGFKSPV
ncbi:MAG: hypothetical protein E6Q97_37130 [Desulfurellales bacterium]|nr:MAG: hypothetical protein E6Q97_37130 [Desulfurellales bacterium]